jgi:glycosyltransferase involved in cell wall biosynthesis
MKILQINKFYYLRGGAERHFFDVSTLLEKNGHTVIPFSMHDERNKKSKYAKYFVSPVHFDKIDSTTLRRWGRVVYSCEARRKIKALIKQEKPDIAHVHLMYHHLSPSILLELKKAGIPIVFTVHDWQALCPNYNLLLPNGDICTACKNGTYGHVFFKKTIKQSYGMSGLAAFAGWLHHKRGWYRDTIDRLIMPSQFANNLFASYGWNTDTMRVLPHFSDRKPVKAPVKKEAYVLYAGRLSREKGIFKLVQHWKEYKIEHRLLIAGRGPEEEKIKKYIKMHGLEKYVELLGFVELEKLDTYMARAAAVVAPSVCFETFGLTLIEAWFNGTGVLVNDMGPLPELVKKAGAGEIFSFKKGTVKKVIDAYMNDSAAWKITGATGLAYAKKAHTPEQYYRELMKVYTELV